LTLANPIFILFLTLDRTSLKLTKNWCQVTLKTRLNL